MTPAGLAQLEQDEGFRDHAYPDPETHAEPWTVGYGCTGPGIGPDTVWTQPQAQAAMVARLGAIQAQLYHDEPWVASLDPVRQDVLENIAYNVGVHGLEAWPKTLALFQTGDFAGAAEALLHEGKWNAEVGNRAVRLSAATKSGSW